MRSPLFLSIAFVYLGSKVMFFTEKKDNISSVFGFTLLELIIVLSIVGILVAISCGLYTRIYQNCCISAAMTDIVNMVREVKMSALDGNYYAISFDTEGGIMTMISGRGADGRWNTGDDEVVRSISLRDKGGVRFGYGDHGPIDPLHETEDGVSFSGNIYICNDRMTGTAGTVYIISPSGAAQAIVINSTYEGYVLWRWNGSEWVKS
jgi:prepilin-type N-terminal cleavage/methylation domain-containing protein